MGKLTRRSLLTGTAVTAAGLLAGCAAAPPSPFQERAGSTGARAAASAANNTRLKKILDRVLNQVNANFVYQSDESIYGEKDYWTPASAATSWRGDCEDHALLCRKLLRQRGVLHSMLLTCWTERGEYHCVLYVDGWVLDVRHPWVMSNTDLHHLGYKWHKVGKEDGRWYYVDMADS